MVSLKSFVKTLTCCVVLIAANNAVAENNEIKEHKAQFKGFYEKEWGQTQPCKETSLNRYSVCSNVLRNEGNAPFILTNKESDNVAVLIHGLSDSPFFMREIANILFEQGFTVVVPLLPGHGKRDADDDMSDWDLAERWQQHIDDVINLANSMGDTLLVGGFSTGGALAVEHYLDSAENIDGLMLFSGALALSDNAEGMSRIWGIKLLAQMIDGSYETHGPNPYKYPNVAGFAGLELMDLINTIREKVSEGQLIEVPLFAAHSQADVTTPIRGIEQLMDASKGPNTFFVIDESYSLCHADLVVNTRLLSQMNFNAIMVNQQEECAVPKENPLFSTMELMLRDYLSQF
ncbi:alpha/beta fold hydrolase [Alteromonas sp. IB21]|uniref:alpha/beta hydrolase n=1 Tax=Alteromonas sp. IB21 TaxID=2779369 RepID=UPI0018E87D4A|nr:alpha/beta fold hydrolase [Alteromonas sp. IB21]MBJ2127771.1 alpha/beta fold hydrolase [Alteromonas sp. IB21]